MLTAAPEPSACIGRRACSVRPRCGFASARDEGAVRGEHARMHRSLVSVVAATALASCSSFAYDLTSVPFPVSASPAHDATLVREPFELSGKDVIWCHQLFGEAQPDIAAMLKERCGDCAGVANFRVSVAGSFHDWLLTHLSLGFVRMKTVTVRGEKLTKKA